MTSRPLNVLTRRALKVVQSPDCPLYLFSLTAREIMQIADISRVSRDQSGDLIGYQRAEVRQHVEEIVDYLDGPHVIFPNPIIIALPSTVRFTNSRGQKGTKVADELGTGGGLLEIPLPANGDAKPGWIVDGQHRALALVKARNQDLPVPVNAFIADSIDIQRDQFLRINNTKPLPRGLVTELLPTISSPLPPRLALRQTPSALCDLLNTNDGSPFHQLIRRSSAKGEARLSLADVVDRLHVSEEELRDDIDLLNVVNFGGGTYVLYAELQGDEIEVDAEPYGDNFAKPARLLPLEAKALVAAIDQIGRAHV